MDQLDAMRVLVLSAERGSFSAASRELRMPLPTVSRKVSELEARLGARLLARSTRRLELTEAGRAYVAAAKRILEDVEAAGRAAAGEFQMPRGELVVTAPLLFGRLHILPVVTDFLSSYPEIGVRLLLSDRTLDLIGEHIDLAVRIGVLPDSALVATRVGAMRTVVCGSPALLARHGEPGAPDGLTALPCVSFNAAPGGGRWRFVEAGRSREIALSPRLSVTSAEAAVWAAAQGVGVTRVLHYQCADLVRQGALRLLLERFEPPPLPVHLLHAARGAMPLKLRAFLDVAAARLRETLRAMPASAPAA